MEQRTFVAILLSLIFLISYTYFFSPKKFQATQQNNSQISQNNKVTEIETSKITMTPPVFQKESKSQKEVIQTLETPIFLVEFSNLGGNLKKIIFKQYNYSFPLTNIISLKAYEDKIFTLEKIDDDQIVYSLITENGTEVTKRYKLDKYLINSEILYVSNDKMSKENLEIGDYKIDFSKLDKERFLKKEIKPSDSLLEYSLAGSQGVYRKTSAYVFTQNERKELNENVDWIGFRDRYFCTIIKPSFEIKKTLLTPLGEHDFEIVSTPKEDLNNEKGVTALSFLIFFGPQDLNLLKEYKKGFEDIMIFKAGGIGDFMSFGLTDFFAKLILKWLNLAHRIIPNWGVCIILLGLFVYSVTYPLTLRSMNSMRKLQTLQPEINKLKEQNKNNPQKLNREIMEFYKKNNINPFSGCFPVLLQMPAFVSLYQVLWRSFSFKGGHFLWIKDLSEPDRLLLFPFQIPFVGNELNLLPILVAILMFFQQQITLRNAPNADPAQYQQQKIMANLMPIMIAVFCYRVASGLALYFTTFYLLSTITQFRKMHFSEPPGTAALG